MPAHNQPQSGEMFIVFGADRIQLRRSAMFRLTPIEMGSTLSVALSSINILCLTALRKLALSMVVCRTLNENIRSTEGTLLQNCYCSNSSANAGVSSAPGDADTRQEENSVRLPL